MNLASDITSRVDDKRILSVDEPIIPETLIKEFPLDNDTADFIETSRESISNIIHLDDPRLLVITGPCSIHNPDEALIFAEKLKEIKDKNPHLYIVMRTYFEKPRTTVGWKGLTNDPHLDDSCDINEGLKIARELLLKINKMGIPTAVEFLDTITPQYFADLVHWGAIGARTTECQEHRKMASGLSMPVGFKNGTNGDVQVAVDAIGSAKGQHRFYSHNKQGHIANIRTAGNPDGHVILRGGSNGTNYDNLSINNAIEKLEKSGINAGLIVDCSHANSHKKHENQPIVSSDVALQVAQGNQKIVGVMIESNLKEGAQKHTAGIDDPATIQAGVSITDACTGWETQVEMISELNQAAGERKKKIINN